MACAPTARPGHKVRTLLVCMLKSCCTGGSSPDPFCSRLTESSWLLSYCPSLKADYSWLYRYQTQGAIEGALESWWGHQVECLHASAHTKHWSCKQASKDTTVDHSSEPEQAALVISTTRLSSSRLAALQSQTLGGRARLPSCKCPVN